MFGAVDVARPRVAHQQLITAEYVQRQKTVVPEKTVKEPAFLFTVRRVIGGIKIQYQLLRWPLIRVDKLIDQDLMQTSGDVPIGAVLKTAQGRRAGQKPITFHRRLQRHIPRQRLMIVQIFITQSNCIQPLPDQTAHIMIATRLTA
jgi:hypothetical protein